MNKLQFYSIPSVRHLYYLMLLISVVVPMFNNCKAIKFKSDEEKEDLDIELKTNGQEQEPTFHTPDDEWIATALRDIAYYLRNHKFNNWDRRYYKQKPNNDLTGFFKEFPMPPLRALHWKVSKNCDTNFYKCIIYLHNVIKTAPLTRDDDIVTVINKRQIVLNETSSKHLHSECNEALFYSEKSGMPFNGPTEKFQWCTSASYYMCWYTMLEQPALSMLGESCDNHANCLDPVFGSHNRDPRSDDRLSFACATYSFCPDICCPTRHVKNYNECHDIKMNPCYGENPAKRSCLLSRRENRNFKDIVKNRWNVSCSCQDFGFIWNTKFGMCVDINECTTGTHTCSNQTEDCLNLPGTFICVCKWAFKYDDESKQCRKHELF